MPLDVASGPNPRSLSPWQTAVGVICAIITLVCVVLGFHIALSAGPIWDDPVEIVMLHHQIAIGTRPDFSYEAGKQMLERSAQGGGFYGVVPQFVAHGLETLASGESWLKITYTVKNIAWRHVVSFLFTLCAAAALFFTVATLTGKFIAAMATTAILLSTPVFLGMSVIDGKDSPVASGLTILSCGLSLLLWHVRVRPTDVRLDVSLTPRFVPFAALLMILSGSFLSFGTRAGALALIAVECALTSAMIAIGLRKQVLRVLFVVGALSIAALAGIAAATLLNPLARKSVVRWIIESVAYAANKSDGVQPLKLYGQTLRADGLPWWYLPGWVVAEYPGAFLVLLALGILAIYVGRGEARTAAYPWVPFFIQGLILPLCIVISGAVIYDRLRHLLFIVPPLCMLAAFGFYSALFRLKMAVRWARITVGGGAVLMLLLNFSATWIWHPYQYAYLSEVARSLPQFAFDTDYLGLSIRESVERMKQHAQRSFRAGPSPTFLSYDPQQWGITVDYVSKGYLSHPDPIPGGGAYYVHSRPSWGAAGLPGFCRELFRIERQGVILGVGGTC